MARPSRLRQAPAQPTREFRTPPVRPPPIHLSARLDDWSYAPLNWTLHLKLWHHELKQLQRPGTALRDARRLARPEVHPVALRHLMVLAVERDRRLAFHQVHELIGLRIVLRVVGIAGDRKSTRLNSS